MIVRRSGIWGSQGGFYPVVEDSRLSFFGDFRQGLPHHDAFEVFPRPLRGIGRGQTRARRGDRTIVEERDLGLCVRAFGI